MPTLSLNSSVTFAENTVNAAPQLLFADAYVAGDNFGGGLLSILGINPDQDRIAVRDEGTGPGQIGLAGGAYANITYGGIAFALWFNHVFYFNGNASATAIEALLENLTYANTSDEPDYQRILTFYLSDGTGAGTNAQFVAVNVVDNPDAISDDYANGLSLSPPPIGTVLPPIGHIDVMRQSSDQPITGRLERDSDRDIF